MNVEASVLKAKPWQVSAPDTVLADVKGMLGTEERNCLYWIARHWANGSGVIIDAGSFVGASSFCLAAGAADGGRRSFAGRKLVHAYDYFRVVDAYVGESISRDFRPIGEGESYLDIYEMQTRPFADMIQTYPGDFLAQRWDGTPVEILFIDIAKTAALNAHVVGQFFPALIPGRSLVIQQDYFHCWHPYIHVTMEFFDDLFELVDEHVQWQSRVWLLRKPIPADRLERIARYDLSPAERMALLDRLLAKSSADAAPMIEVVRMWQQRLDGAIDAARASFESFAARHRLEGNTALWARQALQVRAAL